jgi:8-oxo-dGTP pyrophosphatase MutT (NUDIX family)
MEYRKGVSLVVYKREKEKIFYLILKRKLRWIGYELIKGGKKSKETDLQVIKRELREETKLTPIKIINLNKKLKFIYPKKYQKFFKKKGFLAKSYAVEAKGKIKLSKEHSSYKWLNYKKAEDILTFKETKKILENANKILK